MGNLSTFALTIVSAAILSRYFDKTEYGTYRQILYVYNTLLVIFTAGLPRVFAYYLPRYPLAQGREIVWKISKVLLLAGLVFSVFLFVFSGLIANLLRNPELARGLKVFSPIPLLLLPTLGIEGIFSTYKKAVFIAIYNTLTRIMMLLFIILPVIIFRGSYLYAIYGWIIVSVITLVVAYFFKMIPFRGVSSESSGLTVKEILAYSIPLAVASIAGIAIKAADQFYISRYFGTGTFADFSNGFIELPLAHMITGATSTVLMPLFSKLIYDRSDIKQVTGLWQSTLQKSAVIIYPMVLYFMFFASDVMVVLYSSKYIDSGIYFIIAMTINFFNVIVFAPLLFALGETKFYARLHIWTAIIAWVFGYLIVLILNSPVAIAIFSAARSIALVIAAMIFTSKRLNIKFNELFPAGKLLMVGVHSLLSLVVIKLGFRYLPGMTPLVTLITSCLAFCALLLLTSPLFRIRYLSIIKPILNQQAKS